jgi:DNA-binding LacI/PurR family transcriptional regulator
LSTSDVLKPWRILGFGKHPEIGEKVQARLREAGLAATVIVLGDDEAGDARLIQELSDAEYDGVVIGSFISGQDPELPRPS